MRLGDKRERKNLSHNKSKTEQSVALLLANPVFKIMVRRLREKWGVEEGNPKREDNMRKIAWRLFPQYSDPKLQRKVEENRAKSTEPRILFYNDIIELIRPFKLDKEYWHDLIWEFVRTSEFSEVPMLHNYLHPDSTPIIRPYTQPETGKHKTVIELGDNTTLKDVKDVWRDVERIRKHLFPKRPKFKPWKNSERDSRLYTLHLEGEILPSICRIIDEEFGGDMTETNARKIITTYKKRFGL